MRIKRTLGVIAAATLIMVTACGNAVDENVEKAAGLSSNMDDYFDRKDAVLVAMK